MRATRRPAPAPPPPPITAPSPQAGTARRRVRASPVTFAAPDRIGGRVVVLHVKPRCPDCGAAALVAQRSAIVAGIRTKPAKCAACGSSRAVIVEQ